jgi:outer membrane protein assembly factor BamB
MAFSRKAFLPVELSPRLRDRFRMNLLAAASVVAALAGGHEWPEFRGPGRQGHSMATNVPVRWSATENVVWNVEIPGEGWSSPSVSGGRIFLTTAQGNGEAQPLRLEVLARSTADGSALWTTPVLPRESGKLPSIHDKNGQASPSVLVDAPRHRIFAHFGHLGTAALDLDGRILWQQSSLGYQPVHGNGGSPALVGNTLVFSCDGGRAPFVVGLDADTGAVRWKTPRSAGAKRTFSFCTPLAIEIQGQIQVVLPGSGYVGAYNPANGEELWKVRYGEGYSVVPRPVYAEGVLLIGTGYDTPSLLGIRPAGIAGDATDTAIVWRIAKGAPNTPSAIASGGHVYFVSDAGIASCAEIATGKVLWNERLGGGFSASPVLAEGRILFLNEEGVATVVKAAPLFEVIARNELGERTLASPAVTDNALYLRSQSRLRRIGNIAKP